MKFNLINKTASIVLYILLSKIDCFSQNYFITISKDSVSCRQINFFDTNAQGKMVDFEYVNNENVTIRLKKNDIPEIQKLCQDGVLYLRMPLNINKPDDYYRYGKRVVNGKIIVDVFDDVTISFRLKENFDGSFNKQGIMKETREGIFIRRAKLPDGSVYEVSGLKGLKAIKLINKYMFECEQFEKEYNSNPKYQTYTFEQTVTEYNKICP
jgi:hypothetical protein